MPVCARCLQQFVEPSGAAACVYHPASYQGSERGKLHGTSTSDPAIAHKPLIVYAWDCCGREDANAPGCARGPHESYDG